jgi:hypothetical protein
MVIPISFSGIEINQTMGHMISANKASGHHKTIRMHQAIKFSIAASAL